MPRAILVPLDAPGDCRFSHHWQHPISVSRETKESQKPTAKPSGERSPTDSSAMRDTAGINCIATALPNLRGFLGNEKHSTAAGCEMGNQAQGRHPH